MKRILPTLLVLTSSSLLAATPNDKPSPSESHKPVAHAQHEVDDALPVIKEWTMPTIDVAAVAAKYRQPLPDERAAFLAVIAGNRAAAYGTYANGGVSYDQQGRIRSVMCEAASDADIKLFAALRDIDILDIGPLDRGGSHHGTPTVTDAGLAPLLNARKLREVALVETQVTNEGLKVIGQLPEIRYLVLDSWGITGAGMAHLDGLKHLETLLLSRSSAEDAGMRSIAGHQSLRTLCLSAWVTPKGLGELAPLTSLDTLTIHRNLKDDDLASIGKITSIRRMPCNLLGVTDKGLRGMKGMTRLRSLDLSFTSATDAGMAYVGQMKGLKHLWLNHAIGDAGIAHLAGLQNLRDLSLCGTRITDAGLAALTGLRNLRTLDLSDTKVSAAGVAKLRGMKNLEQINLGNTDISRNDIEKLQVSGIPALK